MPDLAHDEPHGDHDDLPELGEALADLISLLIDEPEEMTVEEETESSGDRTFYVRVDSDDLGKLIGRQGRTARALRSLLEVRGTLDGRRYALEIRER